MLIKFALDVESRHHSSFYLRSLLVYSIFELVVSESCKSLFLSFTVWHFNFLASCQLGLSVVLVSDENRVCLPEILFPLQFIVFLLFYFQLSHFYAFFCFFICFVLSISYQGGHSFLVGEGRSPKNRSRVLVHTRRFL